MKGKIMNHALSLKWMAGSKRRAGYFLFFIGLFLIRLHPLTAAEKPLPDLQGFLQEVKKKMLERHEGKDLVENYTYRKQLVEESLKNDRQVKNTEVKEYEVYHFKEGAYQKLMAKNGVPLSPQELKKQDAEQAEKRRKQLAREAALTPKERQAKAEQSR